MLWPCNSRDGAPSTRLVMDANFAPMEAIWKHQNQSSHSPAFSLTSGPDTKTRQISTGCVIVHQPGFFFSTTYPHNSKAKYSPRSKNRFTRRLASVYQQQSRWRYIISTSFYRLFDRDQQTIDTDQHISTYIFFLTICHIARKVHIGIYTGFGIASFRNFTF